MTKASEVEGGVAMAEPEGKVVGRGGVDGAPEASKGERGAAGYGTECQGARRWRRADGSGGRMPKGQQERE